MNKYYRSFINFKGIEVRYNFKITMIIIALLLFLFNANIVSAENLKIIEVESQKRIEYFKTTYSTLIKWPSKEDNKLDIAEYSEIFPNIPSFEEWLNKILNKKHISRNAAANIFGIKKWHKGEDVLFCYYKLNGNEYFVKETSTQFIVGIKTNEKYEDIQDWENFILNLINGYLQKSEIFNNTKPIFIVNKYLIFY